MKTCSLLAGLAAALFVLVGGPLFAEVAVAASVKSEYEINRVPSDSNKGKWARDGAFVVIGSFVTEAWAKRLAKKHGAWSCKILQAVVEGRLRHRVAFGPFPKEVMKSALSQAFRSGIGDAWLLPARSARDHAKADRPGTAAKAYSAQDIGEPVARGATSVIRERHIAQY